MGDWISDLLIFSAGITGGILISMIVSYLGAGKRRHAEVVTAQALILAAMKQQHEQEILQAALRTTEDIRGELNESLSTLRKTVMTVLDPEAQQPEEQRDRAVRISEPMKSN